jgi:phosphatidylglycerol:prolipoprotein diacylglycerol transferase
MLRDPLSIVKIWEGGMSAHGGIIGGALHALLFAEASDVVDQPRRQLCVVAPLGLFFGRCANFINGRALRAPRTSLGGAVSERLLERDNAALAQRAVEQASAIDARSSMPEAVLAALQTNPQIDGVLAAFSRRAIHHRSTRRSLEGVLLFLILWFVRTRMRQPNGVITGCSRRLRDLPHDRRAVPPAGCGDDRRLHARAVLLDLLVISDSHSSSRPGCGRIIR